MKLCNSFRHRLRTVAAAGAMGVGSAQAAHAAGVESAPTLHGLRGVNFLDTFSTGSPVGETAPGNEHGLDWGNGLDGSVFSSTGDSGWLSGVAEGVSESVTALISDGNFLNNGVALGNVTLDRSLFSYGGTGERTRTVLSALDRFAQDLTAIVPLPAAVPLVLLIVIGVIAVRRRAG